MKMKLKSFFIPKGNLKKTIDLQICYEYIKSCLYESLQKADMIFVNF